MNKDKSQGQLQSCTEQLSILVKLMDSEQRGFGRKETAVTLYELLGFCLDINAESTFSLDTYWNFIVQIHKSVYSTIDQHSEEDMIKYFSGGGGRKYGPIDFQKLKDSENIDENISLFLKNESLLHGVCKILEHYMNFLVVYDIGMIRRDYALVLITFFLEKLKFPEKLISCSLFMKHFLSYAEKYLTKTEREYWSLSLVPFMGFFSKNKVLKDEGGNSWSIECVAEHMEEMSIDLNSKNYRNGTSYRKTLCIKRIRDWDLGFLQDFINLHKNDDKSGVQVAVDVAVRMIKAMDF